jgi:hypothetical protein
MRVATKLINYAPFHFLNMNIKVERHKSRFTEDTVPWIGRFEVAVLTRVQELERLIHSLLTFLHLNK